MKIQPALLLAACLLTACAPGYTEQEAKALHATSDHSPANAWTRGNVAGLSLKLIHPENIESLDFLRDGHVVMDIGRKHGAVAGPVFRWDLVNGRLRIVGNDGRVFDELTLLGPIRQTVKVQRKNGEIAFYSAARRAGKR